MFLKVYLNSNYIKCDQFPLATAAFRHRLRLGPHARLKALPPPPPRAAAAASWSTWWAFSAMSIEMLWVFVEKKTWWASSRMRVRCEREDHQGSDAAAPLGQRLLHVPEPPCKQVRRGKRRLTTKLLRPCLVVKFKIYHIGTKFLHTWNIKCRQNKKLII